MKPLRIATRNSPLALWQAEFVAAQLASLGILSELVPLVSGGDTDLRPIDGTRQVGVFTKRIQVALLNDEGDIAVHSLKDLPTETDDRLILAAVPKRETVVDSLVSPADWTLDGLPDGAKVGTGSRRRMAQLLHHRPDLNVLPIRGNVQTRLSKLHDGEFDAIILAEAGIRRLELHDLKRQPLDLTQMLPAPGQGALGIEVRVDDRATIDAVTKLNHVATRAAVTAERILLAALHGGCLAPIAALSSIRGDQLQLTAVVLSTDGKQRIDETNQIDFHAEQWEQNANQLAAEVSNRMIARGAADLIAR